MPEMMSGMEMQIWTDRCPAFKEPAVKREETYTELKHAVTGSVMW